MYKLYCLSYRFRVRWSYSGEFYNYNDCIIWLRNCSLEPFYRHHRKKYYKLVCPDGDIEFIEVSPGTYKKELNYLSDVTLKEICDSTNLYESLLS